MQIYSTFWFRGRYGLNYRVMRSPLEATKKEFIENVAAVEVGAHLDRLSLDTLRRCHPDWNTSSYLHQIETIIHQFEPTCLHVTLTSFLGPFQAIKSNQTVTLWYVSFHIISTKACSITKQGNPSLGSLVKSKGNIIILRWTNMNQGVHSERPRPSFSSQRPLLWCNGGTDSRLGEKNWYTA